MCSITWVGERLDNVWGRLVQNSGFHGNRKPSLTCNGENDVSTISRLFLIRPFKKRPHLTLAYWTQVSDRCPLGYLFAILIVLSLFVSLCLWVKSWELQSNNKTKSSDTDAALLDIRLSIVNVF